MRSAATKKNHGKVEATSRRFRMHQRDQRSLLPNGWNDDRADVVSRFLDRIQGAIDRRAVQIHEPKGSGRETESSLPRKLH